MGDLKPIGSEKLQGQEKIKRILEISRYNENRPSNINETSRSEYGISLADGNQYEIVKERLGYIIKKTISESETDYIEPMKNRKYYSSYGQALKRLNLLTKEVNRLTENEEGTSLFGEQKKFVLKTPKPTESDDEPAEAPAPPPAQPPAVPTPELPPSPESTSPEGVEDEGMPTMGDEGGEDEGMPTMDDMGDEEGMPDMGEKEGEEMVTFKSIQKLTGKLTQKIREFESDKGMTSENIKYVINMVLSAVDLGSLSDEDKEDIMSKFEGEEEMSTDEMGGEEEMATDEMGGEESQPSAEPEMGEGYGSIFDSIFGESKIDKVISKYFKVTKEEKRKLVESKTQNRLMKKSIARKKMKEVENFSETIEQELASQKFLEENHSFVFVGKTNKKNLVFENKDTQIKISPEGLIL
jgi:hypothetical protein